MLRSFLLIVSLVLTSSFAVSAASSAPHIVVDLDSGQVLSDQQAFDPWHPASLTKLMTAYTVFRAISDGSARADQPVRISRNAAKQPPSRMGYRVGTTMTLENALKLLLIKSANDVSVAIAESVSGSVPRFAQQMTRDAQQLGMLLEGLREGLGVDKVLECFHSLWRRWRASHSGLSPQEGNRHRA